MILGKSMAGKMRFREQAQARDTAGPGELMPPCVPDRMEPECIGQPLEQGAQLFDIGQRCCVTTVSLYHPFAAAHGLLLGASALRAEIRSTRHGLAAIDTEFCCGLGSAWS